MQQKIESFSMRFLRNAVFHVQREAQYLQKKKLLRQRMRLGYPVLIRPSYVLGGQGMQIAISDEDISEFMDVIQRYAQEHPILIDKYLMGVESRG